MHRLVHYLIPVIVLCLLGPGPAQGQTIDELKRENQQLRQRIHELEEQIRQMKGQPTSPQPTAPNGGSGESAATEVVIESPSAAYDLIQKRWDEAAVDQIPGDPGSRERSGYSRFADKWIAATNRELTQRISWPVRLEAAEIAGRDYMLRLTPIDPETGRELSESFPVIISRLQASKLETWKRRGGAGLLELRGVFIPRLQYNPDREAAGVFNNPRFVAPYVEFTYTVNVESIAPKSTKAEPASDSKADQANPDSR